MNILVVDDNEAIRKAIGISCQRRGHQLIEATDGHEALAKFTHTPAPILIVDWVIPKLDGPGLCRAIRERSKIPHPIVFLMSGRKMSLVHYAQAVDAGADDFLYKPVDPFVLDNQLAWAEKIYGSLTGDAARDSRRVKESLQEIQL